MKRALACSIAIAVSMSIVLPAGAQSQGMGGMDMKSENRAKSQTHKASGTVTKVDAKRSSVTIAHGPVQSINWPAMTMTFKVKDKAMLGKVKRGDKVEFSFVQAGRDYTITALK